MFRQRDASSSSSKARGSSLASLHQPPPPPPTASTNTSTQPGGRIRAVEVARGRTGYGFTLSGQSPCVLSCILKGSPADYVGLRSGDHILSVNDINVSKASHEDVVKLIGRCSGVLRLVIAEGERLHRRHHHHRGNRHHHHHHSSSSAVAAAVPQPYFDSCSSDEELGGYHDGVGKLSRGAAAWYSKPKLDSKQMGINRAEKVVAEMQSGGIFNMIFENSSQSSSSSDKERNASSSSSSKHHRHHHQHHHHHRPLSEPEFLPPYRKHSRSKSNPNLLSEEEMARVLHDDSVFLDADFHQLHLHHHQHHLLHHEHEVEVREGQEPGLDAGDPGILNVGMIVGYLGSIELASTGASLESDSIQAIRGSMRRLRAEQKIHSLVLMKVMHDSVRLCSDRGQVLASYPAEKLAFSACCPDDRRFFGLVTMQATDDHHHHHDPHRGVRNGRDDESSLRTSCHVFIVDPDLCHHQVHLGVATRFGFECTPDPDTGGCLEFPPTSQPLLQFVSVLYRDMGENIEGVRARAFHDPDNDAQQNHSTSSNSDSGIGNFLPEEKSNRVLLVDLGGPGPPPPLPRHWDSPPPPPVSHLPPPPPPPPGVGGGGGALRNGHYAPDLPHHHHQHSSRGSSSSHHYRGVALGVEQQQQQQQGQHRWLPVHVLRDWRHHHHPHHPHGVLSSDQESYAESTDGWSSANCSTLPPPMSKIPADRYRAPPGLPLPSPPGDHLAVVGGPPPPPPPVAAAAAGSSSHHHPHQHRGKDEWAKKLFGVGERDRDRDRSGTDRGGSSNRDKKRGGGSAKDTGEKKAGRFRGLTMGFPAIPQRSAARRSFGRSKRHSLARSLDDLEANQLWNRLQATVQPGDEFNSIECC